MTPIAESLTTRTARAAQWRLASALVGLLSQLVVGALLARLLTPGDFGVVALAYVVLGLAQPLGDLGLGGAIVRQAHLTDRHIRTAFTCCVLMGIGIAAIIAAAAPLGSAAMRDAKVAPVLRMLSVGIALRGTSVVAEALLRRQLDFRRQFVIETASYLAGYGGVAIGLALRGHGVWSLVWGGLVQTLIASAAQLGIVRHSLRPLLQRRELEDLLGFGLGAAMSACVNYAALNGDYFVIGRLMGAFNLGLYTRAYGLMNLPHTYAGAVMSAVMLPVFAQVQGEPSRVRTGYLAVTRLTAMIAAPAMTIMVIMAPHFVRALYGPQWTGAVMPLQILSVAGYFRALYHPGGIVAQSVGRVYGELWRQLVYAGAVICGTVVGAQYGLAGVAIGVSAAILYMFVALGQLALSATDTRLLEYVRAQRGALVTAACTGVVALFVRLLFDAAHATAGASVLAILSAAAVPWGLGMLWILGEPAFEPLRASWPRAADVLIKAARGQTTSTSHRQIPAGTIASRDCQMLIGQSIPDTTHRSGRIRAFTKCRNERLRLPAFLKHYRDLGVNEFFVVDNGSTDGTTEYLAEQPDVRLFRTAARFSDARGGTDWLNTLLQEFGGDSWCVTVDVDELLVYPGSDCASLQMLTHYLDRDASEALSCLLLDLYPSGPLRECRYSPGDDPVAVAPYFDATGYQRSPAEHCPGVDIRGGMRQRVFYPELSARGLRAKIRSAVRRRPIPPCLTKVPLVRWDRHSRSLDCNHWISEKKLATETGVLLHFKFLHDFPNRAVQEAARGEYYDGASEYVRYARVVSENPTLTLAGTASTRFEDTGQLVRLDLMHDTKTWRDARALERAGAARLTE